MVVRLLMPQESYQHFNSLTCQLASALTMWKRPQHSQAAHFFFAEKMEAWDQPPQYAIRSEASNQPHRKYDIDLCKPLSKATV